MAFPLGMYTVCTIRLARATNLEPLLAFPDRFVYVALAAWVAVFVAMVHALLSPAAPAVDQPSLANSQRG